MSSEILPTESALIIIIILLILIIIAFVVEKLYGVLNRRHQPWPELE